MRGSVSTRGIINYLPGSPRVVGDVLRLYGRIYDPGMGRYPPQMRRDLDMGGEATLAARWVYKLQSSSNHCTGVGFPHRARRCRPGGSIFSSTVCWISICMEGLRTWGWDLILPGCAGTSTLAPGANLAARWLCEPQSVSNQ